MKASKALAVAFVLACGPFLAGCKEQFHTDTAKEARLMAQCEENIDKTQPVDDRAADLRICAKMARNLSTKRIIVE